MNIDIRGLLDIPDWAPAFTGTVDRDARQFLDTECDECAHLSAVYVEYTVDDPDEGYIVTDANLCGAHAVDGARCILERADRSTDHDTHITVNYWWAVYAGETATERAA
jgi:hypothetical protein